MSIICELISTKLLLILSILKFQDLLLFLADNGEVLSSSFLLNVIVVGLIISSLNFDWLVVTLGFDCIRTIACCD